MDQLHGRQCTEVNGAVVHKIDERFCSCRRLEHLQTLQGVETEGEEEMRQDVAVSSCDKTSEDSPHLATREL
jgi:hypothetical protein